MLVQFENEYILEVELCEEEYNGKVYDKNGLEVSHFYTEYRDWELSHTNLVDYVLAYCEPKYVEGNYKILPYNCMEDYLESVKEEQEWNR